MSDRGVAEQPHVDRRLVSIQQRLMDRMRHEGSPAAKKVKSEAGDSGADKKPSELSSLQRTVVDWANVRYQSAIHGRTEALTGESEDIKGKMARTALEAAGSTDPQEASSSQAVVRIIEQDKLPAIGEDVVLPPSAESFHLLNPSNGRVCMVEPFTNPLGLRVSDMVTAHLLSYVTDADSSHLDAIRAVTDAAVDSRYLYSQFVKTHGTEIRQLISRLRYLGLNRNLVTEGEGSDLIIALIKGSDFGRQTPEDYGRVGRTAQKNILKTGEEPSLNPLHSPIKDADGTSLQPMQDQVVLDLVRQITTDSALRSLKEKYKDQPDALSLVDWTVRTAIKRETLPRSYEVPVREIDISKLRFIKGLGQGDPTSDAGMKERFQASNPIALYEDPDTHRKFIVKDCPEGALQADYFGLEMLQLAGVPIYEFYHGFKPGERADAPKRVLVTGFLEGYQEPAALVQLPEGAPKAMIKTMLPAGMERNRAMQQAMLVEVLIKEYNSKAHNFMLLGESVMHLDQGACLASTASGKYKGFGERVTIEDIQDVLHCYADWDGNREDPINTAYASVAKVIDGKLVINDVRRAQELLTQLRKIPPEKIDEALVRAGFENGERNKAIIRARLDRIQQPGGLLEQIRQKAAVEKAKLGAPTSRTLQYERWFSEAVDTFNSMLDKGGELAYYQHVLRTRRDSLDMLWSQAIEDAKLRDMKESD